MSLFSFEHETWEQGLLLLLRGELDGTVAGPLREFTRGATPSRRQGIIVLDIQSCPYLDSSALGILLNFFAGFKKRVICGLHRSMRMVLYGMKFSGPTCDMYDHISGCKYIAAWPRLMQFETECADTTDPDLLYEYAEFLRTGLMESLDAASLHRASLDRGGSSVPERKARSCIYAGLRLLRDGAHISSRIDGWFGEALGLVPGRARIAEYLRILPDYNYYNAHTVSDHYGVLRSAAEKRPDFQATKELVSIVDEILV